MKQKILTHLPTDHPWADRILTFDTIDSTNTYAKTLASQGAPEGTVVLADRQTGGRGRMGRSFHSPGGQGIYFSVILRPRCHATQLMHLTCATAVAMCEAVEAACGIRPGIKWTNDLVWQKHKLGGILTELSLLPDGTVGYAVVGIGINCTQQQRDFPPEIQNIATSLSMILDKEVSRCEVIGAMITALETMSRDLLTRKEQTMDAYKRNCITLGQQVSILQGESVFYGTARDIGQDGGLIVETETGQLETVCAGEVSVRGMYGYI